MFARDRHRALLRLLERRQRLSNDELLRALRVSPATLRRDLADLEDARQLVRFHGGAAHPSYLRDEPSFEQRSRESVSAKRAMAAAAAALVPAQQTVFLDAGTSCLEVGRALMSRRDLTIICHSIAFAAAATDAAARVLCIGGEVRRGSGALVGGLALSWLQNLRADWAFLGASGLSADGLHTTEISESAMKQALIRSAARRVLVAEAGKWDRSAAVRFAGWSDVQVWVTTSDLPAAARAVRRQGGPRLVTVDLESPERNQP